MKAATPTMTRKVCHIGPVANPQARVMPFRAPEDKLFVKIYMLSGPGAMTSRMAAPTKEI